MAKRAIRYEKCKGFNLALVTRSLASRGTIQSTTSFFLIPGQSQPFPEQILYLNWSIPQKVFKY